MILTFKEYLENLERDGPEYWDNLCFFSPDEAEKVAEIALKVYAGRRGDYLFDKDDDAGASLRADIDRWGLSWEGKPLRSMLALIGRRSLAGKDESERKASIGLYLKGFIEAAKPSPISLVYTGRMRGTYPVGDLPEEMIIAVHTPLRV